MPTYQASAKTLVLHMIARKRHLRTAKITNGIRNLRQSQMELSLDTRRPALSGSKPKTKLRHEKRSAYSRVEGPHAGILANSVLIQRVARLHMSDGELDPFTTTSTAPKLAFHSTWHSG